MTINDHAEQVRQINGTFKQKVNKKTLEAFMRANWGKLTMKDMADCFEISEITVKRYAREFKLVRPRASLITLKKNQRFTQNGILTVNGAVTRHELR